MSGEGVGVLAEGAVVAGAVGRPRAVVVDAKGDLAGLEAPDGAGEGSVGIDAADGLDDAAAEGFIALLARGVRIVFEGILGGNGVRHGEVAPVHGR